MQKNETTDAECHFIRELPFSICCDKDDFEGDFKRGKTVRME